MDDGNGMVTDGVAHPPAGTRLAPAQRATVITEADGFGGTRQVIEVDSHPGVTVRTMRGDEDQHSDGRKISVEGQTLYVHGASSGTVIAAYAPGTWDRAIRTGRLT